MSKSAQSKSVEIKPVVAAPSFRILKSAICFNLSGKSKLTYEISCDADSEIYFRIASNSGGGFYSGEQVLFKSIQAALENSKKPVTSYALWNLFTGKSANTPGFLFAALKAEGLIDRDTENPRCYALKDASGFLAEITNLIAYDVPDADGEIVGNGNAIPSSKHPKKKP